MLLEEPTKGQLQKAYEGCLAWCNTIRLDQQKEPLTELPKGWVGDPLSCPCGRATHLHVSYKDYWTYDLVERLGNLPTVVMRFVEYFDEGLYPDLVDRETKAI